MMTELSRRRLEVLAPRWLVNRCHFGIKARFLTEEELAAERRTEGDQLERKAGPDQHWVHFYRGGRRWRPGLAHAELLLPLLAMHRYTSFVHPDGVAFYLRDLFRASRGRIRGAAQGARSKAPRMCDDAPPSHWLKKTWRILGEFCNPDTGEGIEIEVFEHGEFKFRERILTYSTGVYTLKGVTQRSGNCIKTCSFGSGFTQALGSKETRAEVRADVFFALRSPLARCAYLFLPAFVARPAHKGESQAMSYTGLTLLRQLGYSENQLRYASLRRRLLAKILDELNGVQLSNGRIFNGRLTDVPDGRIDCVVLRIWHEGGLAVPVSGHFRDEGPMIRLAKQYMGADVVKERLMRPQTLNPYENDMLRSYLGPVDLGRSIGCYHLVKTLIDDGVIFAKEIANFGENIKYQRQQAAIQQRRNAAQGNPETVVMRHFAKVWVWRMKRLIILLGPIIAENHRRSKAAKTG